MKTRRVTRTNTKKITRTNTKKRGTRAGKKTKTNISSNIPIPLPEGVISSNIPLPKGVLKGYTILNGNYVVVGAVEMHGRPVVQASPSYGYHKGRQHQQITEFPYEDFVEIFKPKKPIKQKKKSTRRYTKRSTRR